MFISRRVVLILGMLLTLQASACASNRPVTEPVEVVEAFNDEMNAGDLDAAMNFIAEDAVFKIVQTFSGKSEIRDMLQEEIDNGMQAEIIDIRAEGDRVFWTLLVDFGAGKDEWSYDGIVQDGLIVSVVFDL